MNTRNPSPAVLIDYADKSYVRGKSLRSRAFNGFAALAEMIGRGDRAAADYRVLSRTLFQHRQAIQKLAHALGLAVTAIVGMSLGVALSHVIA